MNESIFGLLAVQEILTALERDLETARSDLKRAHAVAFPG